LASAKPRSTVWPRKAYRAWTSGQLTLSHDGKNAIPVATRLQLHSGVNHFLEKVANNRHAYGFSFAVVGLHPPPRRKGAHERPWRPFQSYRVGDPP